MKQIGRGVVCILLLHVLGVGAYSQATSRVTGTVQDPGGAVVPNAVVTLTNQATNVSVETRTTSSGTYVFDGIVPGVYTVTVSAQGFSTFASQGNVLTIAQPMVVNATVKVGQATEKVVVSAEAEAVQTESSGDLGALVDARALQTLPVVGARGRSPIDLVEVSIPGVVDGGPLNSTGANIEGGGVSVNGSRDRAWNYTLDGIDINETSAPGSNFAPLRTNPDSIEGFRVITGSAGAEYGVTSGAQVILETRSGTNDFHGKVFWFYQTPGLNANDPANIENNIPRPQFVQHIPGFSVGGPIFKNKTFFFVNMQFLHASQSFRENSLVYTQRARAGIFRYVRQTGNFAGAHNDNASASDAVVDSGGNPLPGVPIGSYNVAANDPAHAGLDSSIQSFLGLTPLPNNFDIGDGLNTAGFQFLAPEQERQVDFTVRIDHQFNAQNSIFGRWAQGHQNTIGDIVNGGLPPFPNAPNIVDTYRQPRNLALSWRYTPSSTITNEAIIGMNRFGFNFANPDSNYLKNPPFVFFGDAVSFLNIALPRQNYVGNKRVITTYQFVDNLSYVRGPHALTFGTNLRYQRHIDDRGSIGIYDAQPLLYFSNPGNQATFNTSFTGYNVPSDVNQGFDAVTLENGINNLLGRINNIQQGFVAANANQYAPAGTILRDDFRMPEYDFYAQDSWKVRPHLTLNAGLRWEIKLSPRVGSNFQLHPNQPFNVYAPPSDTIAWVPGKLYKDAWKNFAPTVGIAWDPWGDGKTSIRADYRLAYDRINTFVLSASIFEGLPGEALPINDTNFNGQQRVSAGIPVVTPPPGVTPQSLRQPIPFSTTSVTAIDPNWTPPQVHEWSLSLQHQISRDTIFEMAYVGKHAVHLFGGYDSNQAQIRSNGFLNAFNQVYQPFVATGVPGDSPLIDSLVAKDPGFQTLGAPATGSQYLAGSCPQGSGPNAPNPCNVSPYASDFGFGSVAAVAADLGSLVPANAPFFFKFPQFSGQVASPGFIVLDSNDFSWYHALQAQYHGRFHGLQFQANYTWSKSEDTRSFDPTFGTVIGGSSTFGSSSTPFDISNRRFNYAPSDFDRTHVFQGVWTYQIPLGIGHGWGGSFSPFVNRFLGGWEIAGSTVIESGRPFTIYSPSYTTSDIVRSPASCNGCTPNMLHVHNEGGLPNYFTPAQVAMFFSPAPGQLSNLGRNFFRLPGYNVVNMSLGKVTRITERTSLELRLEMQNALNSRHFEQPASARINSGIFGNVDPATVNNVIAEGSSPRAIQLAAKFSF